MEQNTIYAEDVQIGDAVCSDGSVVVEDVIVSGDTIIIVQSNGVEMERGESDSFVVFR